MTVLLVIVSLHHYGTILGPILLCTLWFYSKELEGSGLGKEEMDQEDVTRAISIVTPQNVCFTNILIGSHFIVSCHLSFLFLLVCRCCLLLNQRAFPWQHPKHFLISWICSTWRKPKTKKVQVLFISPPPLAVDVRISMFSMIEQIFGDV